MYIVKLSNFTHHKVASSQTSRLETHTGFFRLLMNGIFDPYVLWPFDKKEGEGEGHWIESSYIFSILIRIRTHDYMVYRKFEFDSNTLLSVLEHLVPSKAGPAL